MSILSSLVKGVGKTLVGTALEHVDLPGKWDDPIREGLKKVILGTPNASDDELAHVIASRADDPELLKLIHAANTNARMAREQQQHEQFMEQQLTAQKSNAQRHTTIRSEVTHEDKYVSRARPSFLYVIYIKILASIPVAVIGAFYPTETEAAMKMYALYLAAIPVGLWTLFGTGYLGYTVKRSADKYHKLDANDADGVVGYGGSIRKAIM